MCGLVGMAGDLNADHLKMFKTLLCLDVLRGQHSTGVAAVYPDKTFEVLKKPLLPQDFFELHMYNRVVRADSQVLIGHNRYATQGKINSKNAHPFVHGDVVGAHNGTLRRQYLLPDSKEFDVDSDNLIYSINKLGINKTLQETCGAFALSYYNSDRHKLYLVRNSERPLYYCYSEDDKCIFWASEDWMLYVSAHRHSIKVKDIHEVDELSLYTLTLPEKKEEGISKPRVTKVTEYEVPVYNNQDYGTGYGNSYVKKSTTSSQAGGTSSTNIVPFDNGDKHVGDEVFFECMQVVDNWIQGPIVDAPGVQAKVYVSDSEVFKAIYEHAGFIQGRVRATSWSQRLQMFTCIIDERTLTLVDDIPVIGPNGKEMTEKEFDFLTKSGCVVCGNPLIYGLEQVYWDKYTPFCSSCWAGDYQSSLI